MRLNNDKTAFIPIKERVAVVRQIFDAKLSGKGAEFIACELNANPNVGWIPEGTKYRGEKGELVRQGAGKWRKSYINKILHNAAVILAFYHVFAAGTQA